MVEYSLANIHLGVGCRYKDYSNLLLDHLSSHKERCSAWVTHRLSDETSMKYVSVQKDILKMSKSTPAKAPPSLPSKHQSLSTIPIMCPPSCKGVHDQHKVTAMTVTLPTARRPYVNKRLKKRFEEICRNRGIPTEHILDVSKTGKFSSLWFPLPESLCY